MKNFITLISFSFAFLFLFTANVFSQTNFYSQGSLNINLVTSWNTERDGSGTDPANFTTAGQIFNVQNTHSMTASAQLIISGAGSRMNIETGGQVTSGAFNHNMTLDMESDARYIVTHTTYGTTIFGTLDIESNFQINNSGGFAPARTYPNLIMNQSTNFSYGGNLNVLGDLIITSAGETRGTAAAIQRDHVIGGDLVIDGGNFVGTNGTANTTFSVGGSFLFISGTFNPSGSTGFPIFTFTGNNGSIDLGGGTLVDNDYAITMDGTRNLLNNLVVGRTLTLTSGELSIGDNTLTINGPLNNNGGMISGSASSNLIIGSSSVVTGSIVFASDALDPPRGVLNNFQTSADVSLGSYLETVGNLTLSDGNFSIGDNQLRLSGGLVITGGTLTGGAGSRIQVQGMDEPSITIPSITLSIFTVNRTAGITLGGAVNILKSLRLSSGAIASSDNFNLSSRAKIIRSGGNFDGQPGGMDLLQIEYAGSTQITTGNELPAFPVPVFNLTVNNAGGVILNSDIQINKKLTLLNGNLDVNDQTINLINSSSITETGSSRITGTTGSITVCRNFKNFNAFDPWNIGLKLTFTGNLSASSISRTFAPYVLGGGEGIRRSYEINPGSKKMNEGLDATLVFSYHESELNGNNENELGLYYRNSTAKSWRRFSNQVLDAENNTITVTGIDAFPKYITARSLGGDNIAEDGNESESIILEDIPEDYNVSQNYPNPFNPETTIKFAIPENDLVSLKAYDITGREIIQLVNEYKSAGYHTVKFNGINLSSGIYFYRITTGSGFEKVMKMSLVK